MQKEDVRIGDFVSIPKGIDGHADAEYNAVVVGVYPNFVTVEPVGKTIKTTIKNCDIPKITLLMHKIKDTLEEEYMDVINEIS